MAKGNRHVNRNTFNLHFDSTTAINEGDRVLLTLNRDLTQFEADQIMEGLSANFPGVHFVIVEGMSVFRVVPTEDKEEADAERA